MFIYLAQQLNSWKICEFTISQKSILYGKAFALAPLSVWTNDVAALAGMNVFTFDDVAFVLLL